MVKRCFCCCGFSSWRKRDPDLQCTTNLAGQVTRYNMFNTGLHVIYVRFLLTMTWLRLGLPYKRCVNSRSQFLLNINIQYRSTITHMWSLINKDRDRFMEELEWLDVAWKGIKEVVLLQTTKLIVKRKFTFKFKLKYTFDLKVHAPGTLENLWNFTF